MRPALRLGRKNREARRALCLGALIMRGGFEQVVQEMEQEAVRDTHRSLVADLEDWLRQTKLARDQSPCERILFGKTLGAWPRQDVVDVSWRSEELGVFQWALGHAGEMPAWDTKFRQDRVMPPLALFGNPQVYEQASALRPRAELEQMQSIALLWHWRSRTTQLQHRGDVEPPANLTFEEIIASTAVGAYEAGELPEPLDEDFPAFGKPYAELDEDEYALATSIATERHLALNWLCEPGTPWDETPTDT